MREGRREEGGRNDREWHILTKERREGREGTSVSRVFLLAHKSQWRGRGGREGGGGEVGMIERGALTKERMEKKEATKLHVFLYFSWITSHRVDLFTI